jgi:GTP-binding protein EngB required for normal cell division
MINFFKHYNVPIVYVLTKSDKTNQKETTLGIRKICKKINIELKDIIITSSIKRKNIDNLKERIEKKLGV